MKAKLIGSIADGQTEEIADKTYEVKVVKILPLVEDYIANKLKKKRSWWGWVKHKFKKKKQIHIIGHEFFVYEWDLDDPFNSRGEARFVFKRKEGG